MVAWRVPICLLLACAGIAVNTYIFHVEAEMVKMPGYQPACDFADSTWIPDFMKGSSCSKVFSSKYAHPMSWFGIVEKGSDYDLGLPYFGMAYSLWALLFPVLRKKGLGSVYYYIACCSLVGVVGLASILKFVLQEFCIVCFSIYCIFFGLFLCFRAEHKALTAAGAKQKKQTEINPWEHTD